MLFACSPENWEISRDCRKWKTEDKRRGRKEDVAAGLRCESEFSRGGRRFRADRGNSTNLGHDGELLVHIYVANIFDNAQLILEPQFRGLWELESCSRGFEKLSQAGATLLVKLHRLVWALLKVNHDVHIEKYSNVDPWVTADVNDVKAEAY